MGKKVTTSYRLSVFKLKESDIKRCKADAFIDSDGVVVELKESWKEIVIALLTVLNYVKNGHLLNALFEAKISSQNMLVTNNKVKTFSLGDNSIYRIGDSNYYVRCDLKTSEYLDIIKKLCKASNFDSKGCFIDMTPYSAVEQDIPIITKKKQIKTEFIRLSDISSHNISKYKVSGVQVGLEAYNCKSYNELISIIIEEGKKKTEDWYEIVTGCIEDKRIKIIQTDEKGRGFKVESHLSKNEAIEIICMLCKKFEIDTRRVIILFKEIVFNN